MKKKIGELTLEEQNAICDKYTHCYNCPLCILYENQTHITLCITKIINTTNKEIEVDD